MDDELSTQQKLAGLEASADAAEAKRDRIRAAFRRMRENAGELLIDTACDEYHRGRSDMRDIVRSIFARLRRTSRASGRDATVPQEWRASWKSRYEATVERLLMAEALLRALIPLEQAARHFLELSVEFDGNANYVGSEAFDAIQKTQEQARAALVQMGVAP